MLPSIIAPAISFPSLVKAQVVTAVFLPGWFTQLHRHKIISELLLNTAKLAFLIINLTLCLLVGGVSTLCLVPDNLKSKAILILDLLRVYADKPIKCQLSCSIYVKEVYHFLNTMEVIWTNRSKLNFVTLKPV